MSSQAFDDLREAQETLARIANRRGPPTKEELEGCVAALSELRRAVNALPELSKKELAECADMMATTLDTVISRVKRTVGVAR